MTAGGPEILPTVLRTANRGEGRRGEGQKQRQRSLRGGRGEEREKRPRAERDGAKEMGAAGMMNLMMSVSLSR